MQKRFGAILGCLVAGAFSMLIATGATVSVHAEDPTMDPVSQEALKKTQQMLRDAKERSKAVSQDPQAGWMDNHVRSLGGSETNTQEIYGLAADVLENIAQEANGDPAKMMELLDRAKKDPNGFAARFTPEQKAKLKELGQKLPNPPAPGRP